MLKWKCGLQFQILHYDLRHFAETKELMCPTKFKSVIIYETFVKACFAFVFLQDKCVVSLGEFGTTVLDS